MGFDYERGRQAIIHDPRLKSPYDEMAGPPSDEDWAYNKTAVPPKAWCTIQVKPKTQKVSDIFGLLAAICQTAQAFGIGDLDALHIMAHGNQGFVKLGKDELTKSTVHAMAKVAGRFRYVVFHCCLVGKMPMGAIAPLGVIAIDGSDFARKVAEITKAKVILGRQSQNYFVRKRAASNNVSLDFGDWEGPVDMYEKDTPVRTFNGPLDDKFDLEKLIFGAKKS